MHEAFYQGFSCPHENLSSAVKDYIVVEHGRAICDEFLQRFSIAIEERSNGLVPFLSAWLSGPVRFPEVWNLAFGRVRATLRNPHRDAALKAALELGLELHAQGRAGSWSSEIAAGTRLRWGRNLFDARSRLEVRSDGERAQLTADDGLTIELLRTSEGWLGSAIPIIPEVRLPEHGVLIYSSDATVCSSFDDLRMRLASQSDGNGALAALQAAYALLRSASPRYLTWATGTVYGILPFGRPDGTPYLSGSYVDRPGAMTCSFPAPTEIVAELLVHEASHQYFYILQKLGSVEDGSDGRLYYSPARGEDRPLMYILLAYHAFANILLCIDELIASGSSTARLLSRQHELRQWIPMLEQPLRDNPALTALGNALWQPLSARLLDDGADSASRKLLLPGTPRPSVALPGLG